MGNRLSKIYTRTGDDGTTGLGDGQRVAKNHVRVEAYGTVDELNSTIGIVLAAASLPTAVRECLCKVQHELFDLGGELCIPGSRVLVASQVRRLEQELEEFNRPLPSLKEFILPGGGTMASACHLARAIARRAERRLWSLNEFEVQIQGALKSTGSANDHTVNTIALRYLNRLSDLLFVIARVLARHEQGTELLWHHDRKTG